MVRMMTIILLMTMIDKLYLAQCYQDAYRGPRGSWTCICYLVKHYGYTDKIDYLAFLSVFIPWSSVALNSRSSCTLLTSSFSFKRVENQYIVIVTCEKSSITVKYKVENSVFSAEVYSHTHLQLKETN